MLLEPPPQEKKRDRDDGPPGPRLSFSPVAWERMGLSLEFADLVSCGKPSEAQQSPPAGCSGCSVGAAQAPGPSGVGLAKKPTWPALRHTVVGNVTTFALSSLALPHAPPTSSSSSDSDDLCQLRTTGEPWMHGALHGARSGSGAPTTQRRNVGGDARSPPSRRRCLKSSA